MTNRTLLFAQDEMVNKKTSRMVANVIITYLANLPCTFQTKRMLIFSAASIFGRLNLLETFPNENGFLQHIFSF